MKYLGLFFLLIQTSLNSQIKYVEVWWTRVRQILESMIGWAYTLDVQSGGQLDVQDNGEIEVVTN